MEDKFLVCDCMSDEHTLRFTFDLEDGEMWTGVYLHNYHNIFERIWIAIKYVFGYKCKYGHFDCFVTREKSKLLELKDLCDKIIKIKEVNENGKQGAGEDKREEERS